MTVAVYIIALLAYICLGYGVIGTLLFINMDTPSRWPGLIGEIVLVSLWTAGLVLGTAAYF